MDLNNLLDRAYGGIITDEEIAYVMDRIAKFQEHPSRVNVEIHLLIQVLGYAGAFSYGEYVEEFRKLIDKFIVFPIDPGVTVSALDILCNDWELTAEYIEQIKAFIRGVDWDEGMDVRVKAICVAGEYVREIGDKECLSMLLEIFKNEHEETIMRKIAYRSICRGVGVHWKDLDVLREIDISQIPENKEAQEIIARAYHLLKTTYS